MTVAIEYRHHKACLLPDLTEHLETRKPERTAPPNRTNYNTMELSTINTLVPQRAQLGHTAVSVTALQNETHKKTFRPQKRTRARPEHLIRITQRNGTQSQLLRLPGEIRNRIWEYASSGADVELHHHTYGVISVHNCDGLAAFHLPQVCRQIQQEVHRLAYTRSTFALPCLEKCKDCITIEPWSVYIYRAAVRDIRSLEPNVYALYLWHYMDDSVPDDEKYRPDVFSLRRYFPNLRRIYVSRAVMEHVAILSKECDYPLTSGNAQLWKDWVSAVLKWMEGEDMEVIFR